MTFKGTRYYASMFGVVPIEDESEESQHIDDKQTSAGSKYDPGLNRSL